MSKVQEELLKRIERLEDVARRQGWALQPDGTWELKRVKEERTRMMQTCPGCSNLENNCSCDVCFGCGEKQQRGKGCGC